VLLGDLVVDWLELGEVELLLPLMPEELLPDVLPDVLLDGLVVLPELPDVPPELEPDLLK